MWTQHPDKQRRKRTNISYSTIETLINQHHQYTNFFCKHMLQNVNSDFQKNNVSTATSVSEIQKKIKTLDWRVFYIFVQSLHNGTVRAACRIFCNFKFRCKCVPLHQNSLKIMLDDQLMNKRCWFFNLVSICWANWSCEYKHWIW